MTHHRGEFWLIRLKNVGPVYIIRWGGSGQIEWTAERSRCIS